MCQRKPGLRCPSHASSALAAAQRRLANAQERVSVLTSEGSTAPPSRVAAAERRQAAAEAKFRRAVQDYDATPAGVQELESALDRKGLSKKEQAVLTGRVEHARALMTAKAEQVRYMPERPGADIDSATASAYTSLALSRDGLARTQAMIAVAPEGSPRRKRLEDQARVQARQVFDHETHYRVCAAQGAPDAEHVTPQEVTAARKAGAGAYQSLARLSHQRAAVAGGGHDERFAAAVDEAGAAWRAGHMPEADRRAPAPQYSQQWRSGQGQGSGRRGPSLFTTTDAMMMMRRMNPGKGGGQVTPGAQQGDPLGILPEPVS